MTSSHPRQQGLGALLLAAVLFPAIASAQPVVRPLEVYGTFGLGQVYLDSSFLDHSDAGGGARLFLTRRFAVQGDLLTLRWNDPYLRSEQRRGVEHTRIGYVGFAGTWGPANRTVRPYWLAGISVFAGGEANTAVGLNGGLGARIFIGDRYFVAPEVRGGLGPLFRASISGGIALSSAQSAPQGATGKGKTRRKKMAIGAGIGGGVGGVVGEYYFGRKLHMAHGPDMVVGAGIGAGAGALIAWALTRGESGASNSKSFVGVAPVLSPSRKALVVTLALK